VTRNVEVNADRGGSAADSAADPPRRLPVPGTGDPRALVTEDVCGQHLADRWVRKRLSWLRWYESHRSRSGAACSPRRPEY
jgi:hypothetical protein